MIAVSVMALCFMCCIVCYRQSLKLAIDVIDASADFVKKTKRIIFVNIFFFLLTIIVILVWMGAFACVLSLNKVVASEIIIQGKEILYEDKKYTYMALYMVFGIIWIEAWLEYTCQFVVMVSAATYYFNSTIEDGEDGGEATVSLGFKFAFLNHMGSLAAGSFIIAVIRFIRLVFLYMAKQAEKASGDNQAVKLVVAIGECCLRCLEEVCDYINGHAYAYMAVSGQNFCSSAWDGFLLGIKHMVKFSFANMLAAVFIALGKVAITVGNCASLYMIMKHVTMDTAEVSSLVGPMVVVAVFSFFTASVFLGLLDTAVMSLMTCLAIDMDLHGGVPKFGPKTFHDSVDTVQANDKFKKVDDENM
jgi:choline transporter-like protein 2/4/5